MNTNFQNIANAFATTQSAITTQCPAGTAIGTLTQDGTTGCVTALSYGASISGNAATTGLAVFNGGAGTAIEGTNGSTSANAYGVLGQSTSTTPGNDATGVKGENDSTTGKGYGVWGDTTGQGDGVFGTAEGAGGIGVYGYGSAGDGVRGDSNVPGNSGVIAWNSTPTGHALDIKQGIIQVEGAGANTSTTAFTWTATPASIPTSSPSFTNIDNPMVNGNPNYLLTVTQVLTQADVYNAHPVGVYYNGAGWSIFNEDQAPMAANAVFIVLVISP